MNMVEISRHRGTTHPRWRMLFAVVVLLSGLVRHCEPMSVKRLTDASPPPPSSSSSSSSAAASSSSSSATLSRNSAESRSQNLGSPSDLAWQAWLLLDSQTGAHSGLDSASFLRRITPKSVFIAPALPALPPCAEGYRADTMGRCVKNVDIDHEAHLGFLLQRLNNRYRGGGGAHTEAQSSNNNQKKSSGPFQLNIPLLSSSDHASSQQDHEETEDSIVIPIVVPARRDAVDKEEEKKPPTHPLLITLYETKNGSKMEKTHESNLFSGNTSLTSSANKNDQTVPAKLDTVVVPVAEFVDDANDTNFSGVVDYKIPIDLRTILNMSNIRTINTSDEQNAGRNGSQFSNSTEAAPMLILLSSMPPNFVVPDDSQLANGTRDHSVVRVSNLTRNTTDKESIGDAVPESGFPSKDLGVPPIVVEKTESMSTVTRESQEIESFYDDEGEEEADDYVDSTDLPEEEESSEAEGGEILKHGEAGMAIPVKDIERLQLDKEERRRIRNETSKIDRIDEISILFNDSANLEKEEKDESAGNVSSEVSIKGDIILETTLLDVTTDKTRNFTEVSQNSKSASRHEEENSDEDLRELFEARDDSVSTGTEPEVVLAPENDRDGTPSTGLRGETTTTSKSQDREELDAKSEELVAAPSSSETLLYDPGTRDRYTEEDPVDEIHTIDEETANSKATAFFPKKSKDSDLFRTFEPGTLNFRPTLDYDRQPPYPRQPVRFPSEEVNSIHGQNYKEGVSYPLDDGLHSSTKSSVFGHQKPFHRGVSLWRPFVRQQQQETGEQAEATITSQRQRLSPLSASFWTAMPLMRDPGLYSTDQDKGTNGGQRRSYASNRFPSVSPS